MIFFHFRKGTPKKITEEVMSRYGRWIRPGSIEYAKTEISRAIEERLTPGDWLRNLREATGLSQSELGALIGDKNPIRAARISDWENDFRSISKPVAKKLAAFFHISAEKFI